MIAVEIKVDSHGLLKKSMDLLSNLIQLLSKATRSNVILFAVFSTLYTMRIIRGIDDDADDDIMCCCKYMSKHETYNFF